MLPVGSICDSQDMQLADGDPPRHLGEDVAPGMRVTVVQDAESPGPWRQEFLGTIVGPKVPVRVIDLAALPEVNVSDADRVGRCASFTSSLTSRRSRTAMGQGRTAPPSLGRGTCALRAKGTRQASLSHRSNSSSRAQPGATASSGG